MAKKAAKSGKKNESYIVQSKVKALIKKSKMKCSSDVWEAINGILSHTVARGCARAQANGRKTLRGADL